MDMFYVRPRCASGYGRGDGTSYENAWNGLEAVDWKALDECRNPRLWICGPRPSRMLLVYVEWDGRPPLALAREAAAASLTD